jgi:hypothetical protein
MAGLDGSRINSILAHASLGWSMCQVVGFLTYMKTWPTLCCKLQLRTTTFVRVERSSDLSRIVGWT